MIAVVDYGMGNLRSVAKAFERMGAQVKVTSEPKAIENSDAIVMPGVGAFSQAMENLERLGLTSLICRLIDEGRPFLGICLGLQILFRRSEEGGECQGLNIIPGEVKRFEDKSLKVPHMGWNSINLKTTDEGPNIFNGIPNGSYFYFVHSYYAEPEDRSVIASTTRYGIEFTSAVHKDNVWAMQFHPEKSQRKGLKVIENFVKIVKERD